MTSEWKAFKIEDIALDAPNSMSTGPFGSSISSKYFRDEGVPVIRGGNLSTDVSNRMSDEGLVFVSHEKAKEFHRSVVRPGDLIFTCWGTINQVGLITEDLKYPEYIISNKQMKLTVDPEKADPLYLYYVFSSPLKQAEILNNGIGAAVPGFNLGQLKKHVVYLPSLKEQKRISSLLDSFDKKISSNCQTNQTLEQIAQAIFKSWFVDFDPVRAKIAAREAFIQQHPEVTAEAIRAAAGTEGDTLAHAGAKACELAAMCAISGKSEEQLNELDADALQQLKATADLFPDNLLESELGEIPEGWRVKSLDQVAVYLNGLALQKFPVTENEESLPVIKIAEMRSGITAKSGRATKNIDPNYIVENGDILFSWSGSLLVKQWHLGEGALNQHLFKVTSDIYPKWLYYFATLIYLPWFQEIAASKATTMGHIQRKHLSDAKVAVCNSELLGLGDKVIAPLLNKSLEVMLEIGTLEELRDSLLPKLLSGELSVKVA